MLTQARAQRSSGRRTASSDPSARAPPSTGPRSVVSEIERMTASGLLGRQPMTQADSMSTATAPEAASSTRSRARTYRGDETSGPVRTPRPARRNSAARNDPPGRSSDPDDSVFRSSLAMTRSPGAGQPRDRRPRRPAQQPSPRRASRRARRRHAGHGRAGADDDVGAATAKASTRRAVRTLSSAVGSPFTKRPRAATGTQAGTGDS